MALPFLECLVLVGIHSYLGIHVIRRKVIFVDLALAQIAALGTIVAFLFGLEPQTAGSYVFSLLFTFVGAAVFSLTRLRQEKIPQEAVIGLVYALAAAVSILIIDRAPHGAEHIKEVLTGTILWVDWLTVLTAAIVYSAVGLFHWLFRDRFVLISREPEEAYRRGISVRLWDFLFYMSFGLVITVSVHTAGVLLVFVFLVVPAILALLITDRLLYQLLIGWGVGTAVSFVGLALSYAFDFPSGPMVVTVYGAALLVAALIIYLVRSKRRAAAAGHIGIGIGVTAAVVILFYLLGISLQRHTDGPDTDHHAHAQDQSDHGATGPAPRQDRSLLEQLSRVDITERPKLLAGLNDTQILQRACTETDDEELRLSLGRRLVELGDVKGREVLFEIMTRGEVPLLRIEALSTLESISGSDFGYSPLDESDTEQNRLALAQWTDWLTNSSEDVNHGKAKGQAR
jgi:zinc/manganese transport system permease protein